MFRVKFEIIVTALKQSCRKVMLPQAFVFHRGGLGTWHASWDRSHDRVPHPLDIRPGDLTSSFGTDIWVVITGDLFLFT